MNAKYSLTHLADSTLDSGLVSRFDQEFASSAETLAYVAEFDARKRYLPAGYPSMQAYCMQARHLSEDAANKRIRAARTARRFPILFEALAAGDLHLAAIVMLGSHLTEANARDLVAAARHRSKAEIAEMLAARFPRPDLPEVLQVAEPGGNVGTEVAPGPPAAPNSLPHEELKFGSSDSRATPLSAERVALQLTISRTTRDKIEYAQALLGHRMGPGDLAGLLDRAFDVLVAELEKKKFGARSRPRRSNGRMGDRATNPRLIPPHVKRAVWQRDRGACTFAGADGHVCGSLVRLVFDHVEPVARGGATTVSNLRLRCRAHNQYEAERVFGAGFMQAKRERARTVTPHAPMGSKANDPSITRQRDDVFAALRTLGYPEATARRALEYSETRGARTAEEQLRAALQLLMPRARKIVPSPAEEPVESAETFNRAS